jgi:hypothetical protein
MGALLPAAATLADIVKSRRNDCQASNHAGQIFGAFRAFQAPEDVDQR